MRKLFLTTAILLSCCYGFAQPTLQQKLYYTCKVWGFVKYYHSEVSTCQVNWDSVLLRTLPLVRAATTNNLFNDALDTLLLAAGPMALSSIPFPDVLPAELKRNKNWAWINAPVFRSDIKTILDTIKNNFRPHANCWVMENDFTSSYLGWLVLPHDSLGLDVNTAFAYPDNDHRLLMFYKHWNIIRYFNPYNYALDTPWDTTLYKYAPTVDTIGNARALYLMWLNILSNLDDDHVRGFTYSTAFPTPTGYYFPRIRLKYTTNKYVVTKSAQAGIYPGDVVTSVNGRTPAQWEDSLKQYYSSGNLSVLRRTVCTYLLGRETAGTISVTIEDSTGATHTFTPACILAASDAPFFNSNYYYADSLASVKWTTMSCDIGYVNMGTLSSMDVGAMYSSLQDKSAIIFDLRYYPNGTLYEIVNLMYPFIQQFAKFMQPDVTYPGTFYWSPAYAGVSGPANPYSGKVIILIDEGTQSQGEFTTMALDAITGSVKVGSQTASADGDVTYWQISKDIHTGFSTLGVFYPNGDSTQRIGIVPDSVIYPTPAGIRHRRDEVLEKALSVAGCELQMARTTVASGAIKVFPNPANDKVQITASNIRGNEATISLSDISGRVIKEHAVRIDKGQLREAVDITALAPGLYFVTIKADDQKYTTKIAKE